MIFAHEVNSHMVLEITHQYPHNRTHTFKLSVTHGRNEFHAPFTIINSIINIFDHATFSQSLCNFRIYTTILQPNVDAIQNPIPFQFPFISHLAPFSSQPSERSFWFLGFGPQRHCKTARNAVTLVIHLGTVKRFFGSPRTHLVDGFGSVR
jgi:hypothetical protein